MTLPGWKLALAGAVLVLAFGLAAGSLNLRIPEPAGEHTVGRLSMSWTDGERPELHTADPADSREVPVTVWYPAVAGTGQRAPYFSGDRGALAASGELSRMEAFGISLVRDNVFADATLAPGRHPVVVLSPGNATNVGFYASIAEELASRGYLVVGVDHPFQVAAVTLGGRRTALYDREEMENPAAAAGKIRERVADIRFVVDRLGDLSSRRSGIGQHLDLKKLGVMGHSNGGIAAVEACRADARFGACMNIDGQMAGGPFSFDPTLGPPPQPFVYLTKERVIHPELARRFEIGPAGNLRIVIPAASHEQFADGALFRPTLNPLATTARDVIVSAKGFAAAFFDRALRGAPDGVLAEVDSPADVYVNVYPLGNNPPIPPA